MVHQQIQTLTAPAGYQPQAIDISVEADLLDFHLLRQRSVTERLEMAFSLMSEARAFSLHCLSQQFAALEPQAFARKIAEAWLQEDCPPSYIPPVTSKMTWIQNSAQLVTQLHTIFEEAGIPYYVTGGVAAIAYGDPRTTRDVDIVLQTTRTDIATLQSLLEQNGFYVAGIDDVRSGRMNTLQITHIETISRADLMLADSDVYAQQQFERRQLYAFPIAAEKNAEETEVYLASPEDIVINKLRWGKGSDSQKQQRDVLAIFKVQQDNLDYGYLHHWARAFEVSPLLETLVTAAGIREIANQQWANAIFPTARKAFLWGKASNRTATSGTEEIMSGNFYDLSLNKQSNTLSISTKANELIARFGDNGQVLHAEPSALDRQRWAVTRNKMQALDQAIEYQQEI